MALAELLYRLTGGGDQCSMHDGGASWGALDPALSALWSYTVYKRVGRYRVLISVLSDVVCISVASVRTTCG